MEKLGTRWALALELAPVEKQYHKVYRERDGNVFDLGALFVHSKEDN